MIQLGTSKILILCRRGKFASHAEVRIATLTEIPFQGFPLLRNLNWSKGLFSKAEQHSRVCELQASFWTTRTSQRSPSIFPPENRGYSCSRLSGKAVAIEGSLPLTSIVTTCVLFSIWYPQQIIALLKHKLKSHAGGIPEVTHAPLSSNVSVTDLMKGWMGSERITFLTVSSPPYKKIKRHAKVNFLFYSEPEVSWQWNPESQRVSVCHWLDPLFWSALSPFFSKFHFLELPKLKSTSKLTWPQWNKKELQHYS